MSIDNWRFSVCFLHSCLVLLHSLYSIVYYNKTRDIQIQIRNPKRSNGTAWWLILQAKLSSTAELPLPSPPLPSPWTKWSGGFGAVLGPGVEDFDLFFFLQSQSGSPSSSPVSSSCQFNLTPHQVDHAILLLLLLLLLRKSSSHSQQDHYLPTHMPAAELALESSAATAQEPCVSRDPSPTDTYLSSEKFHSLGLNLQGFQKNLTSWSTWLTSSHTERLTKYWYYK